MIFSDDCQSSGQYITALAAGFKEIREDYEKTIIKLEDDILNDPDLPLNHFVLALHNQYEILPAIVQLITEVRICTFCLAPFLSV